MVIIPPIWSNSSHHHTLDSSNNMCHCDHYSIALVSVDINVHVNVNVSQLNGKKKMSMLVLMKISIPSIVIRMTISISSINLNAGRIDVNSPSLTTQTELPIKTQVAITSWSQFR